MISKIIKLGQDITIQFSKGWIDDFGNVIPVFSVGGKRYCFIGTLSSTAGWNYCFGIGSQRAPTKYFPAGRAQYLTGPDLESNFVQVIFDQTKENRSSLKRIPNKGGASWSPKSEVEASALKSLVSVYEEINSYLNSIGILYTEGDRYIYGKDILSKNLGSVPTNQEAQDSTSVPNRGNGDINSKPEDIPEVKKLIEAMRVPFKQKFGTDFRPTSTSRSALDQAKAMRFPIQDGTFDSLYKKVENIGTIKQLIMSEQYESAAQWILKSKLTRSSHMAGKAIDVPLGSNGLKSSDHKAFGDLVKSVAASVGIDAYINSEAVSHFHINVRGSL